MLIMRYPQTEDVLSLAANIRDIDALEARCFRTSTTHSLIQQISDSIKASDGVLAVRDTVLNTVVCIFGYQRVHTEEDLDIALIWCLGTKRLLSFPVQFMRWGRMFIDAVVDEFEHGVYNVIHRDNELSKRWLAACGCNVNPNAILEYKNEPFTWFEKVNT